MRDDHSQDPDRAADRMSGPKYIFVQCADVLADGEAALRQATAEIDTARTCFVLAFIPAGADIAAMAAALNAHLNGVPVFGCSTAGQITPEGYETDALMLLAFPKSNFRCASVLVSPLNPFSETDVARAAQRANARFRHTAGWNRLGLVFADGVSNQEDLLISTLETVLDDLPIFGGSAGDRLQFKETFVLRNGKACANAALLLLIETNLEFQGLGFDHFPIQGRAACDHGGQSRHAAGIRDQRFACGA